MRHKRVFNTLKTAHERGESARRKKFRAGTAQGEGLGGNLFSKNKQKLINKNNGAKIAKLVNSKVTRVTDKDNRVDK